MSASGFSGKEFGFPIVIAITALILSLTSGVVNYRQNNLSNLESSLRDTRDQLQLAKNDITDIRMKTVQQLVDAELAVKNQSDLKQKNAQLTEKLKESSIRMAELEAQIMRMDHKLSEQRSALKLAKRKSKALTAKKKIVSGAAVATPALANVDVYMKHISASLKLSLVNAIQNKGFKLTFPKLLDSKSLSNNTTVYYYDVSYQRVAKSLAKVLRAGNNGDVILRKGVSSHAKNKIIVHLIGQQ